MKTSLTLLSAGIISALSSTAVNANDLVISGVIDGPLSGGVPKAVELFVVNDIADLSAYGVGSANNGGGTDGEEFTFPTGVSASAGTYIYVASEIDGFTAFFGSAPDYDSSSMGINGDDAIELFKDGSVIDTFGDINTDGNGTAWEYLDGWAYRTESQGVQIALESDLNGTVFIEGVEGHLMQVFENIISNALSFAPKGSTILISVEKRKNKVFISIENMGPPIPKGKEETIFERFYSERPEHEEYGQNSGLGLSICKQIIDAHMGDIYAENIIGFTGEAIGVRFNIVLDVVNP